MKVIITGATGFVGRKLSSDLSESGSEVIALSRNQEKAQSILGSKITCVEWDGTTSSGWANSAEDADAIINLAGANLSSKYWTSSYKKEILDSRMNAGKAVVQAVMRAKIKPKKLIQASAVGYYGSRNDEMLDEGSEKGSGFISDVVEVWEDSTKAVEAQGVQRVILRSGVILGKRAIPVSLLRFIFKLYCGGYPGSGRQWFPWIHRDDEIRIIRLILEQSPITGILNLTSPDPVKMKEFCRTFGTVIKKPCWVKVPAFALKLILGDMAKETVLASQRIFPKKLLEQEYQFKYPNLAPALADCLK